MDLILSINKALSFCQREFTNSKKPFPRTYMQVKYATFETHS